LRPDVRARTYPFAFVVAAALAACGGDHAFADAGDAGDLDVPTHGPDASPCAQVQGWDNRGAATCAACAQGHCAAEITAMAASACTSLVQQCDVQCGGPMRCACLPGCLTGMPMGPSCLAAL
jgi:hypothetical protein